MTDIARARAILTAVHDRGSYAVLGDWLVEESEGCTCGTSGIGGHEPGCGSLPLTNDPFITLLVGLYPAIDALLSKSDPGNPYSYDPWDDESVDPTNTDEVVHAAVSAGWDAGAYAEADRIAAAILAWAERTGYEEKEKTDGHQ